MISEDTEHLRETLVNRRLVDKTRYFAVYRDEIRYPSGRTSQRTVLEHPGAVCVVPITDDGRVVLVRQWRHAGGRAFWELPAGTRDGDEEPRVCALRELSEETGYTAGTWRDLGSAHNAPGYSNELMFFWEARDLVKGDVHPDEDEVLDVADFSIDEVVELHRRGEVDMKTLAGLALSGLPVRV